MKPSSAAQSMLDSAGTTASAPSSATAAITNEPPPSTTPASSASFNIPDIGRHGRAYAKEAKRAGRINASAVSEAEYRGLLDERQRLLDKKFDGTISKRESNRLEYVRWSLDRIEDARSGDALDLLSDLTSDYERLHSEIADLMQELAKHKTGGRKRDEQKKRSRKQKRPSKGASTASNT